MTPGGRDFDSGLLQQRLDIVAAISQWMRSSFVIGKCAGRRDRSVMLRTRDSMVRRVALMEVRMRLQDVNAIMTPCEEELAVLNARLEALDDLISGA
jgi:hypothetical protein